MLLAMAKVYYENLYISISDYAQIFCALLLQYSNLKAFFCLFSIMFVTVFILCYNNNNLTGEVITG